METILTEKDVLSARRQVKKGNLVCVQYHSLSFQVSPRADI